MNAGSDLHEGTMRKSAREKFLGLSLESTRKSYYPQLKMQLENVKENERRLQLLIDSLPARISFVNKSERYVLVNSRYAKDFGLKRHQIVGQPVRKILGVENYAKIEPYIHYALCGKETKFEAYLTIHKNKKKWFEITYVPDIKNDGQLNGFYALNIDITERKKIEAEKARLDTQLRQTQKFEAIGTLAGGIAHDFNNLLMGIQGRSSLISIDLEADHPLMEHVNAIEEYIQSAVSLTKQLLGFARGGKYEVQPTDIKQLVTKVAAMFGRTKKEIRIHIKTERNAVVVEADRRQLEQVFLNLYVNAWQAMPTGGDLYLQIGCVNLDKTFCKPYEIEPGPFAKVSVTDTGTGMAQETIQRVFDPFFTTKDKDRGTGLGLASVYGIIKNHKGVITVYSEMGEGTTFNIYLPLSEKDVPNQASIESRLENGSETILLVDDEQLILDVGKAMLEKLGYRVLIGKGGQEAFDILKEKGEIINLVILDMIMPGMDGGDVFDKIRSIKPQLPVLLSSGYSINRKAEDIMKRGCNGFIQKPFNIIELSQKLREALKEAYPSV